MLQTRVVLSGVGLLFVLGCVASSGEAGDEIPKTVDAQCEYGDSGPVCTCSAGYEAKGEVCYFIDLCATNHGGCSEHATCTPKLAARTCECESGYIGDGVTCELDLEKLCGTCPENATCQSDGLSGTCVCDPGFVEEGGRCRSLCWDCSIHAACVGEGAATTCVCNQGYVGDGKTCTLSFTPGSVGSDCEDSSVQNRSNCEFGKRCVNYGGKNMCTKLYCESSEDCEGTAFTNLCVWMADQKWCLRGCDPKQKDSCGRPDFICHALDGVSQPAGVCSPACAKNTDCRYGAICNTTTRACYRVECTPSRTCIDPDDVCYVRLEGGQSVGTCVPKCTSNDDCPRTHAICGPDGLCGH